MLSSARKQRGLTKVDFHAGTYVELLSGETGYIQSIYSYLNGQTLITVHYLTPDYLNGQDLIIVKEKDDPLDKFFSRVINFISSV